MKRRWLSFLFSLLISGGLLFFLFSRIEIGRLKEVLVSLYWPWLVIYLVVALAASLLRTWRYQLLLKPRPAKFGDFLLVTLIPQSLCRSSAGSRGLSLLCLFNQPQP